MMSDHEDKVRFNPELAMKLTGADAEIIKEVADVFLEDVPIQLERLAESLRERSQEELIRIAHTIKGAASNIGAERLRAIAFDCEQSARNADFVESGNHASKLKAECEILLKEINTFDWSTIEG